MANNEFLANRVAKGTLTLTGIVAAATQKSDVIIPAGAIITGIRIVAKDAVVLTGASQTIVPKIGTQALAATVNVSDLEAQTVPFTTALSAASGLYITADAELNLVLGATGTSTASGVYDYYVDYIFVV